MCHSTLYPLTLVLIFSALLLYIFYGTNNENLPENQELPKLVIISFILMTLVFDSKVILHGEIRCQSLLGVKGFIAGLSVMDQWLIHLGEYTEWWNIYSYEENINSKWLLHVLYFACIATVIIYTKFFNYTSSSEMTKSLVCSDYQCKAENGSGWS